MAGQSAALGVLLASLQIVDDVVLLEKALVMALSITMALAN